MTKMCGDFISRFNNYTWFHHFVFITRCSFYFIYFCWVYRSLIIKYSVKIFVLKKNFFRDLPTLNRFSLTSSQFSVRNCVDYRLRLSTVWAVSLAALLQKNIKGCLFTIKINCKISVSFFQDGRFNWGLKRKIFSFFVSHMYIFKCTKTIGYFQY